MTEGTIKTLSLELVLIIIVILFIIGANKGWLKNFKLGKSGIEIEGVIKQKESSSLDKLLADKIIEIDNEVKEYAFKLTNALHDNLLKYLSQFDLVFTNRLIIADTVRHVLYNILLKENIKISVRPDNFKGFVDIIIKEIKLEYEHIIRDQEYIEHNVNLPNLTDTILAAIRERIIHDLGYPLRVYQNLSHEKKISLYNQFLPSFEQLGDKMRINNTKECILKNEKYINALSRKPEGNEL